MKFAVRFVLTLLVVAAAIVLVGPSLVDWNRYKPQIEARLERAIGRDVTLGGPISASFLPEPHLEAGDVTIANVEGASAPTLLHLKSLHGQIAFVPLLSGRLVIKGLRLVEPELSLERMADGGYNFSFAAIAPADGSTLALYERADAGAPVRAFGFDADSVSIDKIEIVKGTLTYRDSVLNAQETVSALDGVLSATTLAGPYSAEAGFLWQGRRWGLSGDVARPDEKGVRGLSIKVSEAGSVLKASLIGRLTPASGGEAPWNASGALVLRADRPEGFWQSAPAEPPRSFALEGALSLDAQRAKINDIAMRWGDFTANGTFEALFGAKPRYRVTGQGRVIDLDALLPDSAVNEAKVPWLLALVAPTVEKAPPSDPPPAQAPATAAPPRDLLASLDGEFDVKLAGVTFHKADITAVAIQAETGAEGLMFRSASAVLPGKSELNLDGTLSRADSAYLLEGTLALASDNARDLLGWFGFDVDKVAADRLKRLAYNGSFAVAPGRLDLLSFRAGLDGAQAGGFVNLTLDDPKARPNIDARVSVSRVNVMPYRALFAPGDQRPFVDLASDWIDNLEGSITAEIDSLELDGYDAKDVTAQIGLVGGRIDSGAITVGDVFGLRFAVGVGDVRDLSGQASFICRGEVSGDDLRPFLNHWHYSVSRGDARVGPFTGRFDATLQQGSGSVIVEGALSSAHIMLNSEINSVTAPLHGALGDQGSVITTLAAESDHATELGAVLGFGAPAGAVDAPTAVNIRYLARTGRREFAFSGMVGPDIARLSWERDGDGADANYKIDVTAKSNDGSLTSTMLGAPSAYKAAFSGALTLHATGEGPAHEIELRQLSYQLASEKITGKGTLDISGPRPSAALTLASTHIDVDRYLRLFDQPLRVNGNWSNAPLVLSGLAGADLRMALTSEALVLFGMTFEDVTLDTALSGGMLKISDVKGKWGGGTLTANAALRGGAAMPGFALATKFTGVDSGTLALVALDRGVADGRVDGSITLKGQGETPLAIAAGASGEIKLKGVGGKVHGFDLEAFQARRAALRKGDDPATVLAALTGGSTTITAFDLAFTVDQGVAQTGAGILDFAQGRALLTGTADLNRRLFALDLNLPANGLPATPHLAVTGPFSEPKVEVVSAGVAQALAAEAAARPPEPPPAAVEESPEVPSEPPSVLPPGEPDRLRGVIQSLPSKTQ